MKGLGVVIECNMVLEVYRAIVECLRAEMHINKMVNVEEFWQFLCRWAAVDGCHIPIKCPPGGLETCKEFYNFKNFYSWVLIAFVDAKYRFIWASCGFPANSHDSVTLQSTTFWQQIK